MTNLTCTQARALLMAWLDSELDATTTVSVGEHLASCDTCAERFEREGRLEHALAAELRRDAMPDDVWRRLLGALDQRGADAGPTPTARPSTANTWRWVAAAAALIAAVVLALQQPGEPVGPELRRNLLVDAADAWRAVRDGALPPLSDPAEVAQLLGRLGFADVELPEPGRLGGHPVRLLGARQEVLQGLRAVHLSYTCCDVPTSVFLVSEVDLATLPLAARPPAVRSALTAAEVDGLQARTITAGDVWVGVLGERHMTLAEFWQP